MVAVYIVLSLVIGVVLGVLWQVSRGRLGDGERAARLALAEERAAQLETVQRELAASRQAEREGSQRIAQLGAQLEAERRSEAEQAERRRQDHERMELQFKNLANAIVEERAKAFDASSKKSIGELLKPFQTQLGAFQEAMSTSEKDAAKERGALQAQVKLLTDLNTQVSEEARNLTRALRGDNKAQGNWGEMVLSRVLEMSGLQEGREYETEVSVTTDEDKRRRPDVVVQLPDDRQVIIDAKVSLKAYERYCELEDEAERVGAMKEHVASIRGHFRGLSDKNYPDLPGITTIDYVLMFMPVEAAFIEAVRHDRSLYEEAIAKKVLIVSPSTLLAVLRTIETMWRNERQTRNAMEIARQAGALHDKFVGFAESLGEVGKRIGQAEAAYDKAYAQLSTGHGNLVGRTKKLEALGAKTTKTMPKSLTEAAEDDS